MELTFAASVAGVEKDQAQDDGNDAASYDQRDSGIDESYKRRTRRDQDAQGYDGDNEANHEFVHGGIVREASGGFRVPCWGT